MLAEKPPIDHEIATVSESLLEELILNIGSLASVYHKSPSLLGQSAVHVDLHKPEELLFYFFLNYVSGKKIYMQMMNLATTLCKLPKLQAE